MKEQQQGFKQPEPLKYREEHISCQFYASGQEAAIQIYDEIAYQAITKLDTEKNTLIFVLKGVLHFTIADSVPQEIRAKEMFLLPAGNEFFGVAKTDVTVITCYLTPDIALCSQFTLKHLYKYAQTHGIHNETSFAVLPITDLLYKELEVTQTVMQTGVLCTHYQQLKLNTILLMLRVFYNKDELTTLFYPILNDDFNFKTKILQLYSIDKNVNELIELTGLPTTTFNRKFKAAFQTTPSKWLTHKKQRYMLNKIRMTELPLKEIAEQFNFTPNYLVKFCKDHFGQTPNKLREVSEQ